MNIIGYFRIELLSKVGDGTFGVRYYCKSVFNNFADFTRNHSQNMHENGTILA